MSSSVQAFSSLHRSPLNASQSLPTPELPLGNSYSSFRSYSQCCFLQAPLPKTRGQGRSLHTLVPPSVHPTPHLHLLMCNSTNVFLTEHKPLEGQSLRCYELLADIWGPFSCPTAVLEDRQNTIGTEILCSQQRGPQPALGGEGRGQALTSADALLLPRKDAGAVDDADALQDLIGQL